MPRRPTHGDGSTSTGALAPCRCGTCQEDLIITCPNGCTDAAEGAVGLPSPARDARPPRGPEPRAQPSARTPRRVGVTRDAVIARLRRGPSNAAALAAAVSIPSSITNQTLLKLVRDGLVVATLPPGRVRGAVYRLIGARTSS
jgi:predicted Rossmann fold nucleotide-binding protein DprA/Smf involved in DNA uptake